MRNFQLDQNFLKNPKLALFLIGHSNIKKRDTVLDIGAGSGVITAALARRCKKVIAVEKDHRVASKLRQNIKQQNLLNVEIYEGDFCEMTLPKEPYKVFANPPFSLSAAVFYKLLNLENQDGKILEKTGAVDSAHLPEAIYLILQKQLALKLILTERHYTSQLGKILVRKYNTKIRLPLKQSDFTPPPKVSTVLFEAKLIPAGQPQDSAQYNHNPSSYQNQKS